MRGKPTDQLQKRAVEILAHYMEPKEVIAVLDLPRRTVYDIISRMRERLAREARARQERERAQEVALEGVLAPSAEIPAPRIRRYSS